MISQWGAGSRECIGKHIALLEIYRTLEFLVDRYDFKIAEDSVNEESSLIMLLKFS